MHFQGLLIHAHELKKMYLSTKGIPLGLQQTKGQEKRSRTERERKIMSALHAVHGWSWMWKYFLEESRSSWMTPLYCHGTPETDQTAWCRPASALKTPSLSFFCHSLQLSVFWTLRRDNVQRMFKQKPGRGQCAVLPQCYALKGKTKEQQLFSQCRFLLCRVLSVSACNVFSSSSLSFLQN